MVLSLACLRRLLITAASSVPCVQEHGRLSYRNKDMGMGAQANRPITADERCKCTGLSLCVFAEGSGSAGLGEEVALEDALSSLMSSLNPP